MLLSSSERSDAMVMAAVQIGNLQALAQFLSNASKSLSGTLADILSPSRMIIFGTLLTTLNKPMFAASGYMYATFGTVVTLYWVTAGTAVHILSPCCHSHWPKVGWRQTVLGFNGCSSK